MNIFIPDPVEQTIIFELILATAMMASAHLLTHLNFLDHEQTNELKGFAILAVIFSHIGFFMFNQQTFLEPISWLSGVGVNLFLFLSGYGLMLSSIARPMSWTQFYRKRLLRIFIPLWIVISLFYLLDWLYLARTYSPFYMLQSYLGFYPSADLWVDLNSPLWYFTIILYFYLIFPIASARQWRYLGPFIMIIVTYLILTLKLPVIPQVDDFYKVHFLAFPLGTLLALFHHRYPNALKFNHPFARYLTLFLALFGLAYFTVHSGININLRQEQLIGLVNTGLVILIFWLLPIRFRLLSIFGQYSYELYLLHWPIIARYTGFYHFLPASIATIVYLFGILGLSYLLQGLVKRITA